MLQLSKENKRRKAAKIKKLVKEIESRNQYLQRLVRKKEIAFDNYDKKQIIVDKELEEIKERIKIHEMEIIKIEKEKRELEENKERMEIMERIELDIMSKEDLERGKIMLGEQIIKNKKHILILRELNRLSRREGHIMKSWINEAKERRKKVKKMMKEVKEGIEYRDRLIEEVNSLEEELEFGKELTGHV